MRKTLLLLAVQLSAASFPQQARRFYTTADGLPSDDVLEVAVRDGAVWARTARGGARLAGGRWVAAPFPAAIAPPADRAVRAAPDGLFVRENGAWRALYPREGARSWAPVDVRAATFDSRGRLWFASPQGAGCRDGERWRLYTGAEGLPYDDFTSMAAGPSGEVWFGTRRGAIRFDNGTWEYRQGLRWLPDDEVRSVAVEADGNAWFATGKGVGTIFRRSMTFAEKARFFEDEIDKRHRRTEHGFVDSVGLARPGDLSEWTQHDSDNDGLWTSMYGAGECFAYGATRNPAAKKRATAAFEAMRFLGQVTQGGSHPAPRGFVARTILPVSGRDPNLTYTPERDRQMRETRDKLWKLISPRWPKSADGKWHWKCDTSSDELDGHYFFYANYYDLVAESEAEKRAVREHVAALTDHLIGHGFQLVDHDGKVARWGVFNPEKLNHDPQWWEERSLNSLSMLSYLRTALHITGDRRYDEAARTLIDKHSYGMNVLIAKTNAGPGSGNQSDDEMAFMNFYCLLKYEPDPAVRRMAAWAFHLRWTMEKYELNPLFNYLYAASIGELRYGDAFDDVALAPGGAWREESLDTLRRYPLDRVSWGLSNSHRKDLAMLPEHVRGSARRGGRRDGRVLPIDERYVDKWNHDPWALDYRGDGRRLADGASFLLPYYMGLHHKFLEE